MICFIIVIKQEMLIKTTGLTKLGVDKIPPMIARAVILDMTKHFGVNHMEAGQAITTDDIKLL